MGEPREKKKGENIKSGQKKQSHCARRAFLSLRSEWNGVFTGFFIFLFTEFYDRPLRRQRGQRRGDEIEK